MHGSAAESMNSIPARSNAGGGWLRYRFEYLFCVPFDRNFRPDLLYLPVGTDEERGALHAFAHLSIHIFLDDNSEGITQAGIRIGNEREVDSVFLLELLVRGDRVSTDPNDLYVFLFELRQGVAKLRRFVGSTRGVVFGIKPQH
jgi:hypothetical protein